MSLPSVTAASDATTADDTLLFPIVGALAERERAIIWERTLADLTVARARGRKGGQPSALTNKPLVAAITILKRPGIQVEEGTRRLKVAPFIHRYRPGGRGVVLEPAE